MVEKKHHKVIIASSNTNAIVADEGVGALAAVVALAALRGVDGPRSAEIDDLPDMEVVPALRVLERVDGWEIACVVEVVVAKVDRSKSPQKRVCATEQPD